MEVLRSPLPVHIYRRYKKPVRVFCPETGKWTTVQIDALHAARTSLLGEPELLITCCPRWPGWGACERSCLVNAA